MANTKEIFFKVGKGNYLFIDTETANRNHDICQVGAIVITNGQVEKILNLYVRPIDTFESENIRKNKIYPCMVENAEAFDHIWIKYFSKYITTHIFVAHGANFDLTAIRKTLQGYHINLPNIKYICTQLMAKKLGAPYESRENLCSFFNFSIEANHNAFSDVKDCLNIFIKFCEEYNANPEDFVAIHLSQMYKRDKITEDISGFLMREASKFSTKKVNSLCFNDELDLDFKFQKITITGNFKKYPRPEREKLASELHKRGATVFSSSNLAKSTTMLIAGSDAGPSKLKKAQELGIKIVNEEMLYKMLEDNYAID